MGFSSHRLETLAAARQALAGHQAVVLEEPPAPAFTRALADPTLIEDYLWESEAAFPRFARQQLLLLADLRRAGVQVLQIEPYLQRLEEIHELFAQDYAPADVSVRRDLAPVYAREKECTGALLDFYRKSLQAPFPEVVAAVHTFARADARRFRLRDRLRAAALADLTSRFASVYVEAGYMHQALPGELSRLVGRPHRIRTHFLLEELLRPLLGAPRVLGPGDELTLKYLFAADLSPAEADLLAARSLVYIKLLSKTEMAPAPDAPYPHLAEEIAAAGLVSSLSFADCERLYALIKTSAPLDAWRQARHYLTKYLGRDPGPPGLFPPP